MIAKLVSAMHSGTQFESYSKFAQQRYKNTREGNGGYQNESERETY